MTGNLRTAVGVIGAGAMGSGIAQVALLAGHEVLLLDIDPDAAARAATKIGTRLTSLVEKGRLDHGGLIEAQARLRVALDYEELADCELAIEAVAEVPTIKAQVFARLEETVSPECLLATNTSSLSITALGSRLSRPNRFLGLHFFNPAPLMRLVEIIAGISTSAETLERAADLMRRWGKETVRVTCSPGFIVNRVARPFYGEAMRLLELDIAEPSLIDALLVDGAGFKMGPCELTDLIGHDVSLAVTRSVWEASGFDPRYQPSLVQQALVDAGRLGRKTGQGIYDHTIEHASIPSPARAMVPPPQHSIQCIGRGPLANFISSRINCPTSDGADERIELQCGSWVALTDGRPAYERARQCGYPVILVDRWEPSDSMVRVAVTSSPNCPHKSLDQAIGLLQVCGLTVHVITDSPGLVVARTVAMLANEAVDLLQRHVAEAADIDLAMTLGTNYPRGPLAWCDTWGASYVLAILDNLFATFHDPRYRASTLLRQAAFEGMPLASGRSLT
jgi:3-hydroxybutyryl-CoA dehydrogenase